MSQSVQPGDRERAASLWYRNAFGPPHKEAGCGGVSAEAAENSPEGGVRSDLAPLRLGGSYRFGNGFAHLVPSPFEGSFKVGR